MSLIEMIFDGFYQALAIHNVLFITLGVLAGIILGAIPGLASVMVVPLILPFTFYMDPVPSILMILGAYKGGNYGGSIGAILMGIPGTPGSAATVADGYALSKQGKSGKALKMGLAGSVTGDLITDIILMFAALQLARIALQFGSPEFTVLIVLALTMLTATAAQSFSKGILMGLLGFFLSLPGLDPMTARMRFTFGLPGLQNGIELIAMLIGLFAFSEVLTQIEKREFAGYKVHLPPPSTKSDERLSFTEYIVNFKYMIRSALLGTIVGVIPGLGPTVGSYLGYTVARSSSKNPDEFGKGSLAGIAAAESGNNAVCGANLIPLLGLGIPGDISTAIVASAFLLQGITPGPRIFISHPDVVYGIFAGLIVANIVLLGLAIVLIKGFVRIAQSKVSVIFPIVFMFCFVGSYAINQRIVDLYFMVIFGVIGYILKKYEYPLITLVLGFILAPIFEANFRRSMHISGGDLSIFFSSNVSIILWLLTIFALFFLVIRPYLITKKRSRNKVL